MWVKLNVRWHATNPDGRNATACGISLYGFDYKARLRTLDHKPQDYICSECEEQIAIDAERKEQHGPDGHPIITGTGEAA